MTNTRLSDPEVLELRYPVLLEGFRVRTGSGGRGRWNAGDGIRRTIRFLELWNARSSPATAACRHSDLPAVGRGGRRERGAPQGRAHGAAAGCDATTLAAAAGLIQSPTAGGYGKPELGPTPSHTSARRRPRRPWGRYTAGPSCGFGFRGRRGQRRKLLGTGIEGFFVGYLWSPRLRSDPRHPNKLPHLKVSAVAVGLPAPTRSGFE
jgi:hypothetical protein